MHFGTLICILEVWGCGPKVFHNPILLLQHRPLQLSEVEPVGNKRRSHHPYDGVQGETKGDKTLEKADTTSIRRVQGETRGDKTLAKADTPEIQGETKGDKTLEKACAPPI